MYANLKCDHHGAAWKSSATATCLKKKTPSKSTQDVEVISILDSDEIIPIPTPQTKAKHRAPSSCDSDKVEETPLVVRKSTQHQPQVMIVQSSRLKKSDNNNNDSTNIGGLEYHPSEKASINKSSDAEDTTLNEDSVLEGEGQSSHKCKCTFNNAGHASKRLAGSPNLVKPCSITPITLLSRGEAQAPDAKKAFNLCHRMWRLGGDVASMALSAPSADLLVAEEGQLHRDASLIRMEDTLCATDSRWDMGSQQPTDEGPPLQHIYDYYPIHHPGVHYEGDPYAALYHAAQAFPNQCPSFVHNPWEDEHANFGDQVQFKPLRAHIHSRFMTHTTMPHQYT
ncbi:hypothetical protein EV401DRAFT_2072304 [Pisolithus croceorrhizus]|nr:hypothetical protein EV401DRAFT_2072304 [Pisolithus croceorrhizus]